MKATFNNEGIILTADFNPEDIAALGTIAQITQKLAEKAGCAEDAEKGKAILVSIDDIDFKQFYKMFVTLNPNWMNGKRKIEKITRQFFGKDTYWVIEKTFSIVEREISDKRYYDFRTAIVSGNSFLTKSEAMSFRNKIRFILHNFSVQELQDKGETGYLDESTIHPKGAGALYYIDFLSTDEDNPQKGAVEEPHFPGRVFYGLLEESLPTNDRKEQEYAYFSSPDTAALLCMLIAEMFDYRGVKFKGVDMPGNRLEISLQ